MSTDPATGPAPGDFVTAAVTPIATQVATQVATDLHQATLMALDGLNTRLAANEQAVQDALTRAGTSVLSNVESDPVTQRIVVVGVVAALLVAALLILAFAMLGNATANRWIGAAPAIGATVLAWVSRPSAPMAKRAVEGRR